MSQTWLFRRSFGASTGTNSTKRKSPFLRVPAPLDIIPCPTILGYLTRPNGRGWNFLYLRSSLLVLIVIVYFFLVGMKLPAPGVKSQGVVFSPSFWRKAPEEKARKKLSSPGVLRVRA